MGWAVFVWSIYLVEFKLICYGKQQVGDCLIIIDGNGRCFMGNYVRGFFFFGVLMRFFLLFGEIGFSIRFWWIAGDVRWLYGL